MRILTALLLLPIITGCATPSQIMLDAEVKRLCAIDGGIKVYETVKLPAERFDKYGNVQIPSLENIKPDDEYYYELDIHYYRSGNPELSRHNFKVYRRADKKMLGESVRYGRGGGDIPGPWHDSSFHCPEISPNQPSLEKSIFLKGN